MTTNRLNLAPFRPDPVWPTGKELHIALDAQQVGLERGAQQIAFPSDAVDLAPVLRTRGIDGGNQRGESRQVYLKLTEDVAEKHLGLHSVT